MKREILSALPTEEMKMTTQKKKISLKNLFKKIGPSIILTGIVLGPGSITTAAMLGSNYGYKMLWLLIPIGFMGIAFMMTTYRVSVMTGMPIIESIRKYYGKVPAIIVGITTFLSCMFFTIGNISGTGAGMNLVFGVDWRLGALIMIVIMLYCYFSKGVYSKVEKISGVCVLAMIIAFYATLVATGGPDWGKVATGMTTFQAPKGSLLAALGFIATSCSITASMYGTYLGGEKKWNKDDYFNGAMITDAVSHVFEVILISGAIVLVGAVVLNPSKAQITSSGDLAALIEPIMGRAADIVMGIALLGAGFAALLGNTQRGLVFLNAGFGKPTGLEEKSIRYGSLAVLVFAAIVAFAYGGSPVQLIFIANVATSISTPVAGLFICLLILRKEINEDQGYKPPRLLQVSMIASYIFNIALTIFAF
ncbi:Nramp family divalent metal transporter [Loigolactobacillus zhaoyuanensis]|uniref:Nramp family divalent metal transporter n=1 Tax=Loigolactobacillus zhaoyuanensis TaxID=2486017 RepID=A0ABW8UBF2_9LACO|nr:Nramp family divalent metal transporter [Loigolactobacillus zhaoyuanensis]